VLKELEGEMNAAAEARAYERAAKIRDQIKAVERLDDRGDRRDAWQPETIYLVKTNTITKKIAII
jgi:excinuclease ABC subunit C